MVTSPELAHWERGVLPPPPLRLPNQSFSWFHTDEEARYRQHGGGQYGEFDIEYKLNAHGFRSEEFIRDPDKKAILFVGDSFTFGVGVPERDLWTTQVTRMVSEYWQVPCQNFNLGWGGTSADFTTMCLAQGLDVLKPDVVMALWTIPGRMMAFTSTTNAYSLLPVLGSLSAQDLFQAYLHLLTEARGIYNLAQNITTATELCRLYSVPLVWGGIDDFEFLSEMVDFDGYCGRMMNRDLARDLAHFGRASHLEFAELAMAKLQTLV